MGTETQKLPLYLRPGNGGAGAHPDYNSPTGPAPRPDLTPEERDKNREVGMSLLDGRATALRTLEKQRQCRS